jgi:hypothetical protein
LTTGYSIHRHACSSGHYWDCEGTAVRCGETMPTICMCLDHGVLMEEGDHSRCSIELLDCPRHRTEQTASIDSRVPTEKQAEDGWERIKISESIEEMFQSWIDDPEPNIGWCLLCNTAIRRKDDLIPGTNTHNCANGRALKAKCGEPVGGPSQPKSNTLNSGN